MKKETYQRIVLEFSTILYFVSKQISIPLVQEYVKAFNLQRYNLSQSTGESTGGLQPKGCSVVRGKDRDLRLQVDQESSLLVMYLNVAELCPAILVVLILGTWSDISGKRKVLMSLPGQCGLWPGPSVDYVRTPGIRPRPHVLWGPPVWLQW